MSHTGPKYQVDARAIQGQVIGDYNVVLQQFTGGVAELPTDYAARIMNFLAEYLGSSGRPVPFGGRGDALKSLETWLQDPSAPPYLLLAAPAGRGKSALLSRWTQELLSRAGWAVIFFPVSVRFRTNLSSVVFTALAAQLARLHGEQVPAVSNTPPEVWRAMVSTYLNRNLSDGRKLLLVLDGVDEAADWEVGADLLPLAPPSGVRAIISARYLAGTPDSRSWLRRLGWEDPNLAGAMTLDRLDETGVAEVVRSMGFPLHDLGSKVDIVSELHRLSEGDPLIVRLYVDDLWKRGTEATRLRREDLESIRPGLEGYFDRWWLDQRNLWGNQTPLREPAVQSLLNVLACALGPLSQDDLRALEPSLTTWMLEEALRPLSRFIVGDGRGQGYAFCHPRLSIYFYERLSVSERQSIEARTLTWALSTLAMLKERQINPSDISIYLLQYFSTHLVRSKDPDTLFSLSESHDWYRAHVYRDPSGATYLNDISNVWNSAEQYGAISLRSSQKNPIINYEIRCALLTASLQTLSQAIPPRLLCDLVSSNYWTPNQALANVRQMSSPYARRNSLTELSRFIEGASLNDAINIALRIPDRNYRDQTLVNLVLRLAETGSIQAARDLAESITLVYYRTWTLAGVAAHAPRGMRSDILRAALSAAQTLRSDQALAQTLVKLAPSLPQELLREALDLARAIKTEPLRRTTVTALQEGSQSSQGYPAPPIWSHESGEAGVCLVAPQGAPKASWLDSSGAVQVDLLENALHAARTVGDDLLQAELSVRLSVLAGVLGFPQWGLQSLSEIPHDASQALGLCEIVQHVPESLIADALRIARAITNPGSRAPALIAIVPRLTGSLGVDVLDEALRTLRSITSSGDLATAGRLFRRIPAATLNSRIKRPLVPGNRSIRDSFMADIRHRRSPRPFFREDDWYERQYFQNYLAPPSESRGESVVVSNNVRDSYSARRHSLDAALAVEQESLRAARLADLAPRLTETLLEVAVRGAYAMRSDAYRSRALAALVPRLAELGKVSQALAAARAIEDRESRGVALRGLVHRIIELPDPELHHYWSETLRILATRTRADLLSDLCELTPVLVKLGGQPSLVGTLHALRDVSHWLP